MIGWIRNWWKTYRARADKTKSCKAYQWSRSRADGAGNPCEIFKDGSVAYWDDYTQRYAIYPPGDDADHIIAGGYPPSLFIPKTARRT